MCCPFSEELAKVSSRQDSARRDFVDHASVERLTADCQGAGQAPQHAAVPGFEPSPCSSWMNEHVTPRICASATRACVILCCVSAQATSRQQSTLRSCAVHAALPVHLVHTHMLLTFACCAGSAPERIDEHHKRAQLAQSSNHETRPRHPCAAKCGRAGRASCGVK